MKTAPDVARTLSPGSLVEIRSETWLINAVERPIFDGSPTLVRVTGTTELVRGMEASFLTDLDEIIPVRPEDTRLVRDTSPNHRNGRLHNRRRRPPDCESGSGSPTTTPRSTSYSARWRPSGSSPPNYRRSSMRERNGSQPPSVPSLK